MRAQRQVRNSSLIEGILEEIKSSWKINWVECRSIVDKHEVKEQ